MGVKSLQRKIKQINPELNNTEITMGKIREGLKLMENRKFKNTIPEKYKKSNSNRRTRTRTKTNPFGLLKNIGKRLQGRHAEVALKAMTHPQRGIMATMKGPKPIIINNKL